MLYFTTLNSNLRATAKAEENSKESNEHQTGHHYRDNYLCWCCKESMKEGKKSTRSRKKRLPTLRAGNLLRKMLYRLCCLGFV